MRFVFPYLVVTLELAASGVFAWNKEWRFAIVWGAVGVANFAFAGMK